jgi:hypothetical protein
MRRSLTVLLAAAAGGVLGWLCSGEGQLAMTSSSSRPRTAIEPAPAPATAPKVSSLTAEDVRARIDQLLSSPGQSSSELQLLMTRWVAVDLEGAKAWMRNYAGEVQGSWHAQPVVLFFKAWAGLDPMAAVDEALAVKGPRKDSSLAAVVGGLARADAATIAAVLQKLPPGNPSRGDQYGVQDLVRQLTARDPASAQALVSQLKGAVAVGAAVAVAEVWARTDPQAALTWVQQQGEAEIRNQASAAILTEWARRNPEAVGAWLVRKTPGAPDNFFREAAAEAVARLGATSPQAAAAFAAKYMPPEQLKANLGSFFWRLLADDGTPQSAATICQVVALLPPEALKDAKLFSSGWTWYPAMKPAWDRLLLEPDSPARTFLLGQIGQKLAKMEPAKFIGELMKLPDSAERQSLLETSLSGESGLISWTLDDWPAHLQSLKDAVETLPENVRALGALKLAWGTAAVDPREAAAVIERYPSVAESDNFVLNLGIQFMQHTDFETAEAWAGTLASEKARASAFEGIAGGWYFQDSEGASRWVDSLPPGANRDAAAVSLALHAFEEDPEAALTWAASVHDPARQAETTSNLVRRWARRDAQAASIAVEQSSLPEERKTELQVIITRGR